MTPPWQPCSFCHQLDFSCKHSSHPENRREDWSLTFPPMSRARYSFIQLSELGRHGENENAQTSKRYKSGFEPGRSRSRVRHSIAELHMQSTTEILFVNIFNRHSANDYSQSLSQLNLINYAIAISSFSMLKRLAECTDMT